MIRKALLAATALIALTGAGPGTAPPSELGKLRKVGTVDLRYQSYNVEMVEITGGRFWAPFGGPPGERYRMRPPVNLTDPRLRALARHLGPAYIRVSGTWANSTYLPAEGEEVSTPPAGFNQVLARNQWRNVVAFAKHVDAKIVTSFPASPGARRADGSWNPDQAQRLIDLTRAAGGDIYGAELFNEPTMPQHGAFPEGYSAKDFSRDFRIFRAWARKSAPTMKLTGPGGTAEGTMLANGDGSGSGLSSESLMRDDPGSLDIVSYHHYGTVSARCGPSPFAKPEKALTAEWFEQTSKDLRYYGALRDRFEPGKPLWLNETAQAACGGSPWAQTFLDSFRYLNQLGVLARGGVQVVAHNTLDASDYGLIDQDTLVPRPNYWAAVLWRRTMGSTVLAAPTSPSPELRLFAHCLPGKRGGVGLLAINTSDAMLGVPVGPGAKAWVIQATPLDSKTVTINGKTPALAADGSLSGLEGAGVGAEAVMPIPGKAIVFVAASGVNNPACR